MSLSAIGVSVVVRAEDAESLGGYVRTELAANVGRDDSQRAESAYDGPCTSAVGQ